MSHARVGQVAVLSALLLLLAGCGQTRTLTITVAGAREQAPRGSTLADVIKRNRLQPAAGDLVDVHGGVLRRGIYRGAVLVNGHVRRSHYRLRNGDRLQLARGTNRREPLQRLSVPIKGGSLPDPQFVLARTPGVDVITRGAISHQVVSVHFQPAARQPHLERAVALTFDDGPWPSATARILAVLHRLHADATFFVVGYLAEHYPQLVALERSDGMTIGNHTYNHPEVPPFNQLPPQLVRDEITLGANSLRRLGVQPNLFRPPAGSYSPATIRIANALGERVVLWSVDPADWQKGATARVIATRVLAAVQAGSIVELHDGGGDRSATIKALPAIIKGIRHKHLRLAAIPSR